MFTPNSFSQPNSTGLMLELMGSTKGGMKMRAGKGAVWCWVYHTSGL